MIVKTIGRGQENDIIVNDAKISRIHLQMVKDDNGDISLVDVGSTNGTFVNGKRIASETRLNAGDEVRIGDTVLPWQKYFIEPRNTTSHVHSTVTHSQSIPSTRNNIWLYIGGLVLIIILVGGGVFLHVQNQNKEKERIFIERKKGKKQELEKKALEAHRKAAEESAKDKQKRIEDAEKAKRDAEHRTIEVTTEKNMAEKKLKDAQNAAKKSDQELEITTKFFTELNKANDNIFKIRKICEELKIVPSVVKNDTYKKIIDAFNNAKDITRKKGIVEIIIKINAIESPQSSSVSTIKPETLMDTSQINPKNHKEESQ